MDKLSAKASVHGEFTLDEDQIGEPFHRFQALKVTDFPAAAKHFAEFKSALTRRIQWEEERVFPEFAQRVGGGLANTCHTLREEHGEIARLLDAIAAKLNRDDRATENEEAALQKLLAAHNHREHNVVFPALE